MKHLAIGLSAILLLVSPAWAQTWGSDYNMGSIGVRAGTDASGTITLDCAESGNAFVDQGALSIFVRPKADAPAKDAAPASLNFDVDGQSVSLPVSDNSGDGLIYEKTPETLAAATGLIAMLRDGKQLTVSNGTDVLAQMRLDGATEALDGVDACLTE